MKLSTSLPTTSRVAALAFVGVFSVMTSVASAQTEQSTVKLESDSAKLGYTIGVQIASDLVNGGIQSEIDMDAFLAAQKDVLSGAEPRLSAEQMTAAQQSFQLKQQEAFVAVADGNKAKGEAYLVENKAKSDVKTTESGLQYEVIREGKGAQPTAESTVTVHYQGALIDGTVFDSSYERNQPADFPLNGVIPGFSEGIKLMKEGAKYKLSIPSDIAYGEQGPASIGPNQVLVFDVELIAVK